MKMEFVVAGVVLVLVLCLLFFLGLGRLKHNRRKRQIDDILIPYKPMFENKTPDFIISLDPEDQVPIPASYAVHAPLPPKPKKPAVKMSEQEKRDLNIRRQRAASFLEVQDAKTLAIFRGGPRAGETMILEGGYVGSIDVPVYPEGSLRTDAYALDVTVGQYQRTDKVDSQLRRVYQWKAPKRKKS